MTDSTRRSFLTTAGLTTAAGMAAMMAPSAAQAADDAKLPAGAQGPMAAYIRDVRKGEVALMVEDREVVVTDKPLVARLARALEHSNRG